MLPPLVLLRIFSYYHRFQLQKLPAASEDRTPDDLLALLPYISSAHVLQLRVRRLVCIPFAASSPTRLFLQEAEEQCRHARSCAGVGALMECVRLQRKQLLLWDDALHSLQVDSVSFFVRPSFKPPTLLFLSPKALSLLRAGAARCK